MDEKQCQALAQELAKNLKTPEDLGQFNRLLKKISVETALNAEMTHHLGHEKYQPKSGANSRNVGTPQKLSPPVMGRWNYVLTYSARSRRNCRATTGEEKPDPHYRYG